MIPMDLSKVIQGKEYRPRLHLSVVAIEKGAFGSPSTTGSQLIYYYYYYLLIWKFFTSALADGFSLEFEWQQISSSLQDSS